MSWVVWYICIGAGLFLWSSTIWDELEKEDRHPLMNEDYFKIACFCLTCIFWLPLLSLALIEVGTRKK